uniref:Uncharacterized protein n=1 Tax=Anguilla anguilla TaxID=7936 RepID=A0A0E9QH92_ANGAN
MCRIWKVNPGLSCHAYSEKHVAFQREMTLFREGQPQKQHEKIIKTKYRHTALGLHTTWLF